jgi:hypothetical protein
MAIPDNATGGCNNDAANVLRITFSTALSSAPKYEMYDSSQTTMATGSATTTNNGCFSASPPMYSLVDTTNATPGSNWVPGSATGGSANPNRMKGTTNFVTSPATPGAGGVIKFNMCVSVPSTATESTTMAADLLIRYQYTGSAPSLTWAYNDGSEGSPNWVTLTPGTHGIRFTKSGTVAGGPYETTIPTSGTTAAAELWVTA